MLSGSVPLELARVGAEAVKLLQQISQQMVTSLEARLTSFKSRVQLENVQSGASSIIRDLEQLKKFPHQEIDRSQRLINTYMDQLLTEIAELRSKEVSHKDELESKKKKLQKWRRARQFFRGLKFIGNIANFLGPTGAVVGAVFNFVGDVGEGASGGNFEGPNLGNGLPRIYYSKFQEFSKGFSNGAKLAIARRNAELDKISKFLNDKEFHGLRKKLEDTRNKLKIQQKLVNTNVLSGKTNDLKDLIDSEENVNKIVQEFKESLIVSHTESQVKRRSRIGSEEISNSITILEAGIDWFNANKADIDKIAAYTEAIKVSDAKLRILDAKTDEIKNKLVPFIDQVTADIYSERMNLKDKSAVGLIVSKWQIQNILRD
ncbi:unnamed protein product, partial [Allacma fusca]